MESGTTPEPQTNHNSKDPCKSDSHHEIKKLKYDKKYLHKLDLFVHIKNKSKPLNILIVITARESNVATHIIEIVRSTPNFPINFYLDNRTYSDLQNLLKSRKEEAISFSIFSEFNTDIHCKIIDLLITIGGDGIVLKAASYFSNRPTPPILAFEKGVAGFLPNFKILDLPAVLPCILKNIFETGDLYIERKMRIQAKIIKKHQTRPDEEILSFAALNEIIIDRGPSPMSVKTEIYLNDNLMTTNFGDGIIVSTPTGSTAYAITASGPIIHNYVRSLNIVPICPHSLSFRPIVIPSDCVIKLKTTLDSRANAFISSDGKRIFELSPSYELIITESPYDALSKILYEAIQRFIVILKDYERFFENWISRLKLFLNWSANFTN